MLIDQASEATTDIELYITAIRRFKPYDLPGSIFPFLILRGIITLDCISIQARI